MLPVSRTSKVNTNTSSLLGWSIDFIENPISHCPRLCPQVSVSRSDPLALAILAKPPVCLGIFKRRTASGCKAKEETRATKAPQTIRARLPPQIMEGCGVRAEGLAGGVEKG